MLDFSELRKDGVQFEQLIREILLLQDLHPSWTGVGSDSGRDLLAYEELTGPISHRQRIWLIDCKHFANSGRSVGVGDVTDILDRCDRVNAEGFLLATSTQATSELVRKLNDLQSGGRIQTIIWDSIEIEKRLCNPRSFYIAQQFFTNSKKLNSWKIYYTENGRRWIAHYLGNFLYLESRTGINPIPLKDAEKIIEWLGDVKLGNGEHLRVRKIWHDTPNGPFYECYADYLIPAHKQPDLTPHQLGNTLPGGNELGGIVNWHIRLQIILPSSDYFSPDDLQFYEDSNGNLSKFQHLNGYLENGMHSGEWRRSPPPIRNFSDQHMWNRHAEDHGFPDLTEATKKYLRNKVF